MRAAIYARYSSENQRETSIADQTRICNDRADREGWTVIATFSDREISAATAMKQRPGGRAMLEAAGATFDVLIIEALDRCWRDIVDQERTLRELEYRGLRVVGAADGYDSKHEDRELQRGVRGLLNQQYLRDLAKKTHRGQAGQVLRGFHAGGMAYGYRPERSEAGSKLTIHEPEAECVRWIFEQYAAGWSVQRIAHALNDRRAPSPRGGTWAVSAIYGSPAKGSGILNNDLYRGRYVWNRSMWVKHPETGVRKRIERPESEWQIEQRPELRIVDEDLWEAVRRRFDAPRPGSASKLGKPPSTLLGGLLRCEHCGGAIVAINALMYGCAARKDRGPSVCPGTQTPRKPTDARILALIREQLLTPAALAEVQQMVRDLVAERRRASDQDAGATRKRRAELDAEISRLVEAIATVGVSEALSQRLRAAEAERSAIARRSTLARATPAVDDPTAVLAAYRRMIIDLEQAIRHDMQEARAALAEIFGPIKVKRLEGGIYAEIRDPAESILATVVGDGASYLTMVAGTRYRDYLLHQIPNQK